MSSTTSAEAAITERVHWQCDLASRYNVDRVTAYRWEREGKLPTPDVIIGRRRGWYESTLRAYDASTLTPSAIARPKPAVEAPLPVARPMPTAKAPLRKPASTSTNRGSRRTRSR